MDSWEVGRTLRTSGTVPPLGFQEEMLLPVLNDTGFCISLLVAKAPWMRNGSRDKDLFVWCFLSTGAERLSYLNISNSFLPIRLTKAPAGSGWREPRGKTQHVFHRVVPNQKLWPCWENQKPFEHMSVLSQTQNLQRLALPGRVRRSIPADKENTRLYSHF